MAVSVVDLECYGGVASRLRALGGLNIWYTVFSQTPASATESYVESTGIDISEMFSGPHDRGLQLRLVRCKYPLSGKEGGPEGVNHL